jgi:hypothetical protein
MRLRTEKARAKAKIAGKEAVDIVVETVEKHDRGSDAGNISNATIVESESAQPTKPTKPIQYIGGLWPA